MNVHWILITAVIAVSMIYHTITVTVHPGVNWILPTSPVSLMPTVQSVMAVKLAVNVYQVTEMCPLTKVSTVLVREWIYYHWEKGDIVMMSWSNGGYRCSVLIYTYLPLDVDECADLTVLCLPNFQCVNTEGSYTCVCNNGFFLSSDNSTCCELTRSCMSAWRMSLICRICQ